MPLLCALLCALFLCACNPALNWRETRIKDTTLVAMMPCKPDAGARAVPLNGRSVDLHMTGCDAGGATFAIAHADVVEASAVPAVLVQWRTATLANMGALSSGEALQGARGAGEPSSLVRVSAQGRRQDGSAVTMQGVWFARGSQVFHAVVYAGRISADTSDTFFYGLRFQ